MLKTLALTAALVCGVVAAASAKALTPPAPPQIRYQLPNATGTYPADSVPEGRSIYQMPVPGHFYGADEQGYPTGLQPNPQIGG